MVWTYMKISIMKDILNRPEKSFLLRLFSQGVKCQVDGYFFFCPLLVFQYLLAFMDMARYFTYYRFTLLREIYTLCLLCLWISFVIIRR